MICPKHGCKMLELFTSVVCEHCSRSRTIKGVDSRIRIETFDGGKRLTFEDGSYDLEDVRKAEEEFCKEVFGK
jgi:hypothetical protein